MLADLPLEFPVDSSSAIPEFLTRGPVPTDWPCQHLRPRARRRLGRALDVGSEPPSSTAAERRSSTMTIIERTAETTSVGGLARSQGIETM